MAARPRPDAVAEAPRTLADHLRQRRYELGLTQREAAGRLGVSADTVRNWERGRTAPGVKHGPSITRFLGYFPLTSPPDLPGRLTVLRWRLGLTQRQLAERLEVDESTVAGWEKGQHRPSWRHRQVLADLLGKSLTQPESWNDR